MRRGVDVFSVLWVLLLAVIRTARFKIIEQHSDTIGALVAYVCAAPAATSAQEQLSAQQQLQQHV